MRHHAIRQKVSTPFGSLYAEAEFDDTGTVRCVSIAHPSKHRDTAVGDALERLAEAFNDIFADLRLTHGAGVHTALRVSPTPASQATGPAASSGVPGRSFSWDANEGAFEGGGE